MRESNVLVFGIGTKGTKYKTTDKTKVAKEYKLWTNMLERCTEKLWERCKSYTNVTCSENFKSYSFFYEWCHTQTGFNLKDENGRSWNLDKDLLIRGNKIYSEDTCVFVPHNLNLLLSKRDSSRGAYPIGVSLDKKVNKFTARCNIGGGVLKYLGYHRTPSEAFRTYKAFKEAYIKQVANNYKHLIDERAYQALINYEVNEND